MPTDILVTVWREGQEATRTIEELTDTELIAWLRTLNEIHLRGLVVQLVRWARSQQQQREG